MIFCPAILLLLQTVCVCLQTAQPTFIPNEYLAAGTVQIIFSLYLPPPQPQSFVVNLANSFTGIPQVGYGIKNYQGNNHLGTESFDLRHSAATASSFTITYEIGWATFILALQISYMAIDPSFPHRFNSFTNVPVDFGSTLTNITTKNPTAAEFYSNTIQYSSLAINNGYNRFEGTTLDNNKIVLLISSLFIQSTNELYQSTVRYPINFNVSTSIVSSTHFQIRVDLSVNVRIEFLKFSIMVIDAANVASSYRYELVFQEVEFAKAGGFIQVVHLFESNFVMGLADFGTSRGLSVLSYEWKYATVNGVYGIKVQKSLPINYLHTGSAALTRQTSNVLFLKAWECPPLLPFYNTNSGLCQDTCGLHYYEDESTAGFAICSLCSSGCATCALDGQCLTCDSANDHRQLIVEMVGLTNFIKNGGFQFLSTSWNGTLEINVANLYSSNWPATNKIVQLDYYHNEIISQEVSLVEGYYLLTFQHAARQYFPLETSGMVVYWNGVLVRSVISVNYKLQQFKANVTAVQGVNVVKIGGAGTSDGVGMVIDNVQLYKHVTSCQCLSTFYDDGVNFQCISCANTMTGCLECSYQTAFSCISCSTGYFLNNQVCEVELVNCQSGFVINPLINQCVSCASQCSACLYDNISHCLSCSTQFSTYFKDNQCRSCSRFCLTCDGPNAYECLTCDNSDQHRVLKLGNCICDPHNYQQALGTDQCAKKDPQLCDYGFSYIASQRRCKEICKDQAIFQSNNDCIIPTFLECSSNSACTLHTASSFIKAAVIDQPDSSLNQITLSLDLLPADSVFYANYNWSSLVRESKLTKDLNGANIQSWMQIIQAEYVDGHLVLTLNLSASLEGTQLSIGIEEAHFTDTSIFNFSERTEPNRIQTNSLTLANSDDSQIIGQTGGENTTTPDEISKKAQNRTYRLGICLSVVGTVAFLLCLFVSNSLTILVNLSSLQVGFLALMTIAQKPVNIQAFIPLKNLIGYNYAELISVNNETLHERVREFHFSTLLVNNFNVMFFFQAVFIAATAIFYYFGKEGWFKTFQKASCLVMLFNLPNLIFSVSIVPKLSPSNLCFTCLTALALALQLIHVFQRGSTYSGFPQSLDLGKSGNYKKFLSAFLISRILSCIILAQDLEEPFALIVGVGILEVCLFLAIFYTKPFLATSSNVCNIAGELLLISLLACLYVCNYRSLNGSGVDRVWDGIVQYLVFIFVAMLFTLVVNLVLSIYNELGGRNNIAQSSEIEPGINGLKREATVSNSNCGASSENTIQL